MRKDKSTFRSIEVDYSSGGHGCILSFDLIDMYEKTKEIFKNNIISETDFKIISDTSFIDFVRDKLYE